MVRPSNWKSVLDLLPRGSQLDEPDWQRRHRFLKRVLLAHVPALAVIGLLYGWDVLAVGIALLGPVVSLIAAHLLPGRRWPAVAVTTGLVYCSTILVVFTYGTIEAHFHFFIIIGFIALYQDWAPFLCNIGLTVLTHGIGTAWQQGLIFNHPSAQQNPWVWSLVHGIAVLVACAGVTVFWRVTEDTQDEKNALTERLAQAEIGRRQFTSDLLVNLARRNQTMLYRQLDIINQLEEAERDPDALAELFKLDHLATRVRRNAESLLVLSGEQPARVWREPVPLRDVVRAAIAETEDLERVAFTVDELTAVSGMCVTDLTHLLAELTENAVRFSPPESVVTIRTRPTSVRRPDGYLLTIEDWGVGMPPDELAAANELLANPPEVDLSVAQRLGFHVVARLAARHDISVQLEATPGSGITAVVHLPASLLEDAREPSRHAAPEKVGARNGTRPYTGPGHGADGAAHATLNGSATMTATLVREMPQFPPLLPEIAEPPAGGGWTGWWETPSSGPDVPAQRAAEPAALAPGTSTPMSAPTGPSSYPPPVEPPPAKPYLSLFVPQAAPEPMVAPPPAQAPPPAAPPAAVPTKPASPAQPAPSAVADPAPVQPVLFSGGPTRRPVAEGPGATVQGLRKRVPQASLAPELRRAGEASVDVPAPRADSPGPPPTAGAASALSRYQASRRSAQAMIDRDGSAS